MMDLAAERSYPTPLSASSLLPLLLLSLARQRHTPDGSKKIRQEYDYVIVGAGSSGSALAGRLSEKPCVSVLLLEAGKAPPRVTEVPGISRSFWFTDLDWQYRTSPQKHTGRGLIDRRITWPSGKALGGTSILNAEIHVRGNRKDYDNWEAMGAKGWSYKDVLPYFKKLEDNREPKYLENGYHGVGGPVTVHTPRYIPEFKYPVLQSAKQYGHRIVDSNGPRQTGFFDYQADLRDNQRCSTAKAYLVPAENRTNMDILPNAMVTKILIHDYRARGVRFDFRGHTYEVKARKEVIVSAGAVNTPQLLMLSGIGPKEELRKFNIPVIADLPVGRNFHDHGSATFDFALHPHIPNFEEKLSNHENIARYIHNRTGPLASVEGITLTAFLNTRTKSHYKDLPNVQMYFIEGTATIPRTQFGYKPQVYKQVYGPYEDQPLVFCFVHHLQPKSRGSITLRSKNPYDPPVIDPNYLAEISDAEDIVDGLKACKRIATSEPLRRLGARPLHTLYPGCEKYADDEDYYFDCQIRTVMLTASHPAGTAKMGNPHDPSTVVDPQLRVKGIKGLRVVDASVMPAVISGNTNVPAIMIAEKAADMIKKTIHCHHDYLDDDEWNSSGVGDMDFEDDPYNHRHEKNVFFDEDNGSYKGHSNRPVKYPHVDEDSEIEHRKLPKYEEIMKEIGQYPRINSRKPSNGWLEKDDYMSSMQYPESSSLYGGENLRSSYDKLREDGNLRTSYEPGMYGGYDSRSYKSRL